LQSSFKPKAQLKITIERLYKKRSSKQNRFYWGVIVPIIQEALYNAWGEYVTANETHEQIKVNCSFEEIVNEETGEICRKIISTTEQSTTEFMEYWLRIEQWAKDWLGVPSLPEPLLDGEQAVVNYPPTLKRWDGL